ncbi:hypothetical protein CEXT_201731 [Caerostris extrusa]|uniref:Uncharacterized protein n=1 Tax=Caerostris extrusa TaxID=172846 RepID=A0AAV4XVT5_CAEEX|nr:hypothetical protein CEXT_201731 [Caerostris extrusa]
MSIIKDNKWYCKMQTPDTSLGFRFRDLLSAPNLLLITSTLFSIATTEWDSNCIFCDQNNWEAWSKRSLDILFTFEPSYSGLIYREIRCSDPSSSGIRTYSVSVMKPIFVAGNFVACLQKGM